MPAEAPPSASRYYALSAGLATQTATEATRLRARSLVDAAALLIRRQVVTATLAEQATAMMLEDQDIRVTAPDARLNPTAFTTAPRNFEAMTSDVKTDWEFQRIVASIMQETARAAQQASIAARPHVSHVRHLNPPSCSRCVVLAGRVYRYSEGFLRHPGDDCIMVPVTDESPDLTYDPVQLAREGKVTGLSRDDLDAINHGADLGQVVNVRLKKAGLTESGRVLARAGRPTPSGILREAASRADAIDALSRFGYVL